MRINYHEITSLGVAKFRFHIVIGESICKFKWLLP